MEAKTNASSLTAKLADTTAELRASNSRVEDVTAKVWWLVAVMAIASIHLTSAAYDLF